jgi:hypothetical protein
VEAIECGDKNKESPLLNIPFTPVPGADLTIARSTKHRYADYGIEWNNSGNNGFYCKFKCSPIIALVDTTHNFSKQNL